MNSLVRRRDAQAPHHPPPLTRPPDPDRRLVRPVSAHAAARKPGGAGEDTVWLFDLDNTLHDCSYAIFRAIDVNMTRAVMHTLDVDQDTANTLRKRYWLRYGATVIGLVRHHGIKASEFLQRAHDFDPAPLVHAERGLAAKLARLPGRKVLLTNAPRRYAYEVLKALAIAGQFELIWSIDQMTLQGRMRPKPSIALMRQVLARLNVPAHRAVLVEDTVRNLRPARQLGMRTVHIHHPGTPFSGRNRGRPHYVDLRLQTLSPMLTGQRYPH
jgi:putative hydrolase of the HAD superfamily